MLRIDIPGWSIKAIAFGIAAVAIYTAAFGVIDEIYQRSITVGASVILVTLTVPLVPDLQIRRRPRSGCFAWRSTAR